MMLDGPPATASLDPARPMTVLLVEDAPADAGLIRDHLREAIDDGTVELYVVRTLNEAIAELQHKHYACVLLDLGLPDGRGVGNVEALRAVDRRAALVVLTGLDDDRMAIQALDQGAQDYVIKGDYSAPRLLGIMRHAVQRNRQMLELEEQRNRSFYQASHDTLTGLANRQLFTDRARQVLESVRRHHQPCSVLVLDLDGFKPVNDRLGHLAGDELLVQFARILSSSVRSSDTVARMGGDEFVILLGPAALEEPLQIAERILERAGRAADIAAAPLPIRCSIGIARAPEHGDTLEALLRKSDRAMYEAKRRGGQQALMFEDHMEHPGSKRVTPLPLRTGRPG